MQCWMISWMISLFIAIVVVAMAHSALKRMVYKANEKG